MGKFGRNVAVLDNSHTKYSRTKGKSRALPADRVQMTVQVRRREHMGTDAPTYVSFGGS